MDSPGFNTQYLERLSTDELINLADKHGLDIPVGIERVFIIEELLFLDKNGIGMTEKAEEHVVLPKQHNISMVEVLVRDPLWAFVFWEIKGYDENAYEHNSDFDGYWLRVIPLKEGGNQPLNSAVDMAASFTVAVGIKNSAWYLGFPPDSGGFFKVELCVQQRENYVALAASKPFKMPRLIEPKNLCSGPAREEEIQSVYRNPLAQLSGVECFSLLRSMDRQLRPRSE